MRFLKTINPDNMAEHTKQMQRFNVGEDSPVFDGLYQFCQVRSACALSHALAIACAHAPLHASALFCTLVRGPTLLHGAAQASSGGSIGGAVKLNKGQADVAINWAGGLHHAKKCEASGFCYANDIVLAILEVG